MIDEIINKYGYCGFIIKTLMSDVKYFCISEPNIEDVTLHGHSKQHAAEKEIEEKIDKYLENN